MQPLCHPTVLSPSHCVILLLSPSHCVILLYCHPATFLEARLSALALGTLAISQQLVGGRPPAGLSAAAPGAAGWSASRQTSQVGQVGYTVYIR